MPLQLFSPGNSLSTETAVMLGFGALIGLVLLAFAAVKVTIKLVSCDVISFFKAYN